jgi:hypothetical protein
MYVEKMAILIREKNNTANDVAAVQKDEKCKSVHKKIINRDKK